jgi:hypothetical protein
MSYIKRNRLEITCLLILGFCFFWQLGTYPGWFDHIVGIALWPQLGHVYDQQAYPLQGWARWQWQDMYQHNAGYSPTYGFLVELGLRSYGLSLIAVRLPQTVVAFIVCTFGYMALRKVSSRQYALVCALLLGTAPWFLLMMRSGGIIGFGGVNLILTGALLCRQFTLAPKSPFGPALAIVSAVSVALLPYAHTSTRVFAVLLAVAVPLCYRIIGKQAALAFALVLVLLVGPQLLDLQHARSVYFHARGEALLQVAASYPGDAYMQFIRSKLIENISTLNTLLLGLNPSSSYWFGNLADSYWNPTVILYPKFLVPFFLLGIVLSLQALVLRRSTKHGLLLALLALCCVPSLMSGIGGPNQARLFLAVIPIYALIAYGGVAVYRRWLSRNAYLKALAVVGLVASVALQVQNFFAYEKGSLDEKMSYRTLMHFYAMARDQCPQATMILHEYPDFDVYSYVMIRWIGGTELETAISQHTVWLLRHDNVAEIQSALGQANQAVLISHAGSVPKLQNLGLLLPPKLETGSNEVAVFAKGCALAVSS